MDVVFDFGNVLIEWNPARLIEDHFESVPRSFSSPAEFMTLWMNETWAAYDRGEINTATTALKMEPVLGCDATSLTSFFEKIPHVLAPVSPTIDALEKLFQARDKGASMRVFYLSNMPREFADVLEARFDWIARFDGGIFSGREGASKPDAAIYEALESRYELTPSNTLFFDDVIANVETAQTRGWQTVQVREPSDVVNGLRDARVV
jgi:putative hydrolase of the HAD superfamily